MPHQKKGTAAAPADAASQPASRTNSPANTPPGSRSTSKNRKKGTAAAAKGGEPAGGKPWYEKTAEGGDVPSAQAVTQANVTNDPKFNQGQDMVTLKNVNDARYSEGSITA